MVADFISGFRQEGQLVVVDPVLGDNGELYPSIDRETVEGMARLIGYADVITPNITEAAVLLGESPGADSETAEMHLKPEVLKSWLTRLAGMMNGPDTKKVIITSVPTDPSGKRTAVVAYDNREEQFWKVECEYVPADYPGTGDVFTSVVTGALLQGDSLPIAVERAVRFVLQAVRATFGYPIDPLEGFLLERVLPTLQSPLGQYNYEHF
jgi:pyridoxine kinase